MPNNIIFRPHYHIDLCNVVGLCLLCGSHFDNELEECGIWQYTCIRESSSSLTDTKGHYLLDVLTQALSVTQNIATQIKYGVFWIVVHVTNHLRSYMLRV